MFGNIAPALDAASSPPLARCSPPRWAGPATAAWALACAAAAAWGCSDSPQDVCTRAIHQQSACDPNMAQPAAAAADAITACSQALDGEAPSCREAARQLSDCIAFTACADIDEVCYGLQQGVAFNCGKTPFLE